MDAHATMTTGYVLPCPPLVLFGLLLFGDFQGNWFPVESEAVGGERRLVTSLVDDTHD